MVEIVSYCDVDLGSDIWIVMEMGGKSEGEKEAEDRERWKRRTGCLKVKIEMSKLVKSQRSTYVVMRSRGLEFRGVLSDRCSLTQNSIAFYWEYFE